DLLDFVDFFHWLYGAVGEESMRDREQLWLGALSVPLQLGLMILGLRLLRGTRFAELGLTPRRAGSNIAVGYAAWLFLTPLALAIQSLALAVTPPEWVREHPVGTLAQQPLAEWEWVMLFAAVVVLAPL